MEQWRPVKGFEGYAISDKGRVFSYKTKGRKAPDYLKPFLVGNPRTNLGVSLSKEGKAYTKTIRTLLIENFPENDYPKKRPGPIKKIRLYKPDKSSRVIKTILWGMKKDPDRYYQAGSPDYDL